MKPIRHSRTTRMVGEEGYKDKHGMLVNPLPLTDVVWGEEQAVVTFWQPSAKELGDIINGGLIAIYFVGPEIPNMGVVVETTK